MLNIESDHNFVLKESVNCETSNSIIAESTVTRRFSDFLGLHDKLSDKYLQNGRVIPPAPDKSVVNMTKVSDCTAQHF